MSDVAATLQDLGSYYQKHGARSRLEKGFGRNLLDKLKLAEASLPSLEPKKKGIFG